ncbi:hypothetical protein MUK42_36197 [Musa troglodytarum]|uniref:Uncharacterized protein n=1 Tax=Musa troglodytarum TaxID=320322 RepID=A0A9E7EAX6_9LILI|nr:hypothetical protein MUK42_36197 [Musa troglodytarum]
MCCNSRSLVASPLPCGHRFTTRRLLGLRPPANLILLRHTAPPSATTTFCLLHHHNLPAQPLSLMHDPINFNSEKSRSPAGSSHLSCCYKGILCS